MSTDLKPGEDLGDDVRVGRGVTERRLLAQLEVSFDLKSDEPVFHLGNVVVSVGQ